MQESGKKIMKKFSSSDVVAQNLDYVDKRRKGLLKSLKTKFPRLDNYLMGGIELDTMLCISALSGAGKSTLSKCFRDSIWQLNKDVLFNQYIFNFEMVAHQQIARSIVADSKIPLKKLYSVDEPLTDLQFQELKKYYDELSSREGIWFIENPGTAQEIVDSLWYYYLKECKPKNKVLVYEIDHALLTKGKQGDTEKERIDSLMYALVQLKKAISADGGHSIGIILSQMNREIRSEARVKNKDLHRPGTECLFGASSIEQCCDYIIFSHIPAKLNISSYTEKEYPTQIKIEDKMFQMPYLELVKQRSGEADLTIPMWNKLHRFDFDEMDKETFNSLYLLHKQGKECKVEYQKQMFS